MGFTGVPACRLFQTLTKALCEQQRGSQRLTILSIGVYRGSRTLATPLWIHTAWLRQGSTNTVSRLLLLMHAASTLTRTILTTCKCHIGDVRPGTWPESLGAEVSKVLCFECDERHTSRDTGYYNMEVWSRVICWNRHLLRSQEIWESCFGCVAQSSRLVCPFSFPAAAPGSSGFPSAAYQSGLSRKTEMVKSFTMDIWCSHRIRVAENVKF